VIAAAGNEGDDVSDIDCADFFFFEACWEEAGWMPCEAWEVVCVGGLDWNSIDRHPQSNYGRTDDSTTVDIYGPYEVWVTSQPAADGTVPDGPAQTMSGTSFSAPFVAGVAALIWAANPGLSPGDVEDILLNSAHKRWDLIEEYNPRRWVNAYDAVIQALGNAPPDLTITYPPSGAIYPKGATVEFFAPASDPEDGTPTVTWTSSVDGTIGGGTSLFTRDNLSLGTHTLTATATDSGGLVDAESVTITIRNDPPDVDITQPLSGSKFVQGEPVRFQGEGYDTSEGVLPGSRLEWSSDLDSVLGTGRELLVTTLSQGTHTITLRASDNQGSSDQESITVIINEPPPDLPPAVTITWPEDGALLPVQWDSDLGLRYIDGR
jgi:hypothetical protein